MSVKGTLSKLQNVDVADLRNIDFQQVQDNMRGKPDLIVIILLLISAVVGGAYLYTDFQKKSQEISEESTKFTEQLEAAEQNKILTQKFDKFLEEFPEKIIIDDLTDQISGFAIDRNVNIISFSPAKQQKTDYTLVETININVVAKEFHQLIAFIDDIENAPFAIRIETYTARLERASKRGGSGRRRHGVQEKTKVEEAPSIAATIEIATIGLKE